MKPPMDPKSIVMIAYYFPPDSSAAVYRSLRFLKGLVGQGWRSSVICCEPYQYERYDPHLLTQIPSAVRIIRVSGRDPWRAFQTWRGGRVESKLAGASPEESRQVVAGHYVPWRSKLREAVRKVEAWAYRPDIAMPWIKPATQKSIALCKQDRPDIIWATIGPLTAGVVACRASEATGVPYVLDFRDPWGLDYYPEEIRRPSWARKMDNETISRLFRQARAVVFMFESIAEQYLRAFPGTLTWEKIHIIPNGFEGAVDPFAHAPGDRCTVLYAGTMSTYRYDTLLEGLVRYKRQNAARATRLCLRFVGTGVQDLAERIANMGISDLVEIRSSVSSEEVRRLQREAHALLILGRTSQRRGHELVAGAKLFGYLQAGRPLIGVVSHDETRRILQQVGNSMIADADAPDEVANIFERLLEAWSSRTLERFVPDRAACESYSSSNQISTLVDALDGKPREYRKR